MGPIHISPGENGASSQWASSLSKQMGCAALSSLTVCPYRPSKCPKLAWVCSLRPRAGGDLVPCIRNVRLHPNSVGKKLWYLQSPVIWCARIRMLPLLSFLHYVSGNRTIKSQETDYSKEFSLILPYQMQCQVILCSSPACFLHVDFFLSQWPLTCEGCSFVMLLDIEPALTTSLVW